MGSLSYNRYSKDAADAVKGLDMEGWAAQFVTPISGTWLEKFGILTKN